MKKASILIVEDCPENRALFDAWLVENGFEVVAAEGGVQALELLTTVRPDLILTDIMMPEMDGLELIRRIRGDQRLDGVPIVAMTAFDTEMTKSLEAGATLAFDKFQGYELLVSTIEPMISAGKVLPSERAD